MKLIGVTQRVVNASEYEERRDALDQQWGHFLKTMGYLSYPIPNQIELLPQILSLPLQGVLLTGGNTLDTDAPERDAVETELLDYSLTKALPLLGVCRGMQLIVRHFGSKLEAVEHHVACSHPIDWNGQNTQVNSYHDYGTFEVLPPLQVTGKGRDGVIESVQHQTLPLYGIMWHPERHSPYRSEDVQFFKSVFG